MVKKKNPTRNREKDRNFATVGCRFDYKLTVTIF